MGIWYLSSSFLLLVLPFCLFFLACSTEDTPQPTPVNEEEELSVTLTIDNEAVQPGVTKMNVSLTPLFTLVFSENVLINELKSNNFSLKKGTISIPFTMEQGANSKTINLTPNKPLESSSTYNFTIEEGVSIKIKEKTHKLSKSITAIFSTSTTSTITFDLNAEDAKGNVEDQKVVGGQKITQPTVIPTREGYEFGGWVTTKEVGAPQFDFDEVIRKSRTLFAKWNPKFQVTFNLNAEDATGVIDTQSIARGGNATQPQGVPNRQGYTFAGWSKTMPEDATRFNFEEKITNDLILYAQWMPKTYQITFDLNGGQGNIETQNLGYGNKVTEPTPLPTRNDGYVFLGWGRAPTAVAPFFDFDIGVTESKTLYAIWLRQHLVTFDLRGGDAIIESQSVKHGQIVKRPTIIPTKTGYTFSGWGTTNADDALAFNFDEEVITETKTLYAKWATKIYKVKFNTTGGAEIDEQRVVHGLKATRPVTTPTREGFTFFDWCVSTSVEALPFDFDQMITTATNIYAKWTQNEYQVTFDLRGGTGSTTNHQTVPHGTTATRPSSNPTHIDGYDFTGWGTTDSDVATDFDFTQPIIQTTIIYARWARSTYQVSFDLRGGNGDFEPQIIPHGERVHQPPTLPTRSEGFSFIGWRTTPTDNAPLFDFSAPTTERTTIYASWALNTYQVTLNLNGGTGTTVLFQNVLHGNRINPLPSKPVREGYTFDNWVVSLSVNAMPFDFSRFIKTAVTIYASWTQNEYQVTFNLRGGIGSTTNPQTVLHGNPASQPAIAPTRSGGYDFAGWGTTDSDATTDFDFTQPIIQTTIIYARWVRRTYQVFFDLKGGNGDFEPQIIPHGSTASQPAIAPTREGYAFEGWGISDTDMSNEFDFSQTINENVVIYAKWTINKYVVTFVFRDSTDTTTQREVTHRQKVSRPDLNPNRFGYEFVGWGRTTASHTEDFDFDQPITETTIIYAIWTTKEHPVMFDLNGGVGAINLQMIPHGTTATRPSSNPTRSGGYDFAGWGRTSEVNAFEFNFDNVITGPMTLYARWRLKTYQVDFNLRGGIGNFNAQTISHGTAVSAPPLEPTREGYSFAGWGISNSDASADFDFGQSIIQSATIYAKWSRKSYLVTFDLRRGMGSIAPQTVLYDFPASPPAIPPTREGYSFAGWGTTDSDAATDFDFTQPVIETTIIYARWVRRTYQVDFNLRGGIGNFNAQTISHGTAVSAPPLEPTREGYSFAGWGISNSDTAVNFDFNKLITTGTTIYAKWSRKSYLVTFDLRRGMGFIAPQTVLYDFPASPPAIPPTREGYSFAGWGISNSDTAINFDFNRLITTETTIYAKWNRKTFQITFMLRGATAGTFNPQTVTYGERATRPSEKPERTGFSFVGWGKTDSDSAEAFNFNDIITSSTTIYAKWIATITVSFNLREGIGSFNDQTIRINSKIAMPSTNPTRGGYEFAGWGKTDSDSAEAFNFNDIITSSTTIYAKWIATITVSFNLREGIGSFNDQTIRINSKIAIPSTNPTRGGYEFAGWGKTDSDSAEAFNFNDIITSSTTIYAKWIATITVSFNLREGIGSFNDQTIRINSKIASPSTSPTREGYEFAGWGTADSDSAPDFDFSQPITANTTIYAKWRPLLTGINVPMSLMTSPLNFAINKPITETVAIVTTPANVAITYSVTPDLPVGLSMNTTTGVISGTPTVLQTSKKYTITATPTADSGYVGTATADIYIAIQ